MTIEYMITGKMSPIDISTNSPHYFCWKSIGTVYLILGFKLRPPVTVMAQSANHETKKWLRIQILSWLSKLSTIQYFQIIKTKTEANLGLLTRVFLPLATPNFLWFESWLLHLLGFTTADGNNRLAKLDWPCPLQQARRALIFKSAVDCICYKSIHSTRFITHTTFLFLFLYLAHSRTYCSFIRLDLKWRQLSVETLSFS